MSQLKVNQLLPEQEQQETLQRLCLATDSAQIGVWEVDISDGTTYWDEKMYDLYGFAKNTLFASLKILKKPCILRIKC